MRVDVTHFLERAICSLDKAFAKDSLSVFADMTVSSFILGIVGYLVQGVVAPHWIAVLVVVLCLPTLLIANSLRTSVFGESQSEARIGAERRLVQEGPSPLVHYDARRVRVSVVGVGGGGGSAVNSMIEKGLHGVDFFAVNTDVQALQQNQAPNKIQIGKNLTRGLGSGADPTVGYRAVEEDREEIANALTGSDIVFVTAGMGGGTGTGGAPLVCNIAKSLGALVVAIVTRPFQCEGKKRAVQADQGIEELRKQVDTLIVIPNQRLLTIVERRTPLMEAFAMANSVLYGATRGISELITVPGLINIDFASVRTIMREMGDAVIGIGEATGKNRAVEAAHKAISSPLLDDISISGARGVLVNIAGGPSLSLFEVDEATEIIRGAAGDEASVILGAVIDENLTDEIIVTVIATGFNQRAAQPTITRPVAQKPVRPIERIPTGADDLQFLDMPAYKRRGIELNAPDSHDTHDPPGGQDSSKKKKDASGISSPPGTETNPGL